MKRLSMVMLTLMLSSFVITFTSCDTDTDDLTGPINNSLPEVTNIEVSSTTIPAGATIDVSVTAKNGDSYAWSADYGEFSDASSASTSWTASGLSSSTIVKLVCTVTGSGGSRNASVSVTAVFLTAPIHHWTFDANKNSEGGLAAVGDNVTISTDAKVGAGAALFPGGGYDFDLNSVLTVDGIPTGPGDVYTIMTWIKTEEIGYSVYSRIDPDEGWNWDWGSLKTWIIFLDYGYPSSVFLSGIWNPVMWEDPGDWWNGEWHHYAAVHNESDLYTFYVDGEEVGGGEGAYGETHDDEGSIFTMGGGGWGTILNGSLDDFKYYNQTISPSEIALIASQ